MSAGGGDETEADRQVSAVLYRGPDGDLIRKSGIITVVLKSGWVRPADSIDVKLPFTPFWPLERI